MAQKLLFLGVYGLAVIFLAAYGLVMSFSPKQAVRFLNWLSRKDAWSKPNADWAGGSQLQLRIAGAAITVMSLVLAIPIPEWIADLRALRFVSEETTVNFGRGSDWFAFSVGAAMLLGGGYILLLPDSFLRWIAAIAPYRKFPREPSRESLIGARAFGVLVAASSLIPMYVWFRSR